MPILSISCKYNKNEVSTLTMWNIAILISISSVIDLIKNALLTLNRIKTRFNVLSRVSLKVLI
jgi:hypothetical protein